MSNKNLRTVIILGIISIVSILGIQLFWIKKNVEFQETNISIQNKQDSLNRAQFNDKVLIALKNVATDIQRLNDSEGSLYGNVQQRSSNYFTVELQDTVHPFLLEQLLKWEFDDKNIREDFQYGIYDCFNDSIVVGNYVQFESDSMYTVNMNQFNYEVDEVKLRLNTDLHYFGVMFPSKHAIQMTELPNQITPWYYLFFIIIVLTVFFGFSISVILKQKRLSEIKNDFINNMTHELKTPIATIRISSETLLNIDANTELEKLKRYAGIIYKENKRLEQQVERVLNVAKLDRKELKFELESFDVHEIIEEAKDNFEFNQLEELGGSIEIDLAAESHLVHADLVHITNVIYNLLDNAIKYCETTPAIKISSRNYKDRILINIKDNGKGISRENVKLIFDKFYRVPTGNLHDVKGFGLGLYYVKTILEELGGRIDVKSTLGKGSEFIITLTTEKK